MFLKGVRVGLFYDVVRVSRHLEARLKLSGKALGQMLALLPRPRLLFWDLQPHIPGLPR